MSVSSFALLRSLADGAFHSGAALGVQFNMTRAGIHHHIGLLREMGVTFEAIQRKGYRIPGGMTFLDVDAVSAGFPGIDVRYVETLPSTQDYLIPVARNKPMRPVICITEYQTQGRGRGNKTWHAPLGTTLCFSLCIRLNKPMHALSGFTLALGVAICQSLEQLGAVGLQLKWPNDVYAAGKKLGGILTEAWGDVEGPTYVVIGVGLNVHAIEPWGSVEACVSTPISRQQVMMSVVSGLLAACEQYEREGFASFKCQYEQHDFLKGKTVRLRMGGALMEAIVTGVSSAGNLEIDRAPFSLTAAELIDWTS